MGKALNYTPIGLASKALGGPSGQELLQGKETPATPNEVIDLASPKGREIQEGLLSRYGDAANQDVGAMAQRQTSILEEQARAGVGDQERLAQKMVAQRGLGGTSLGLNAILNQSKGLGDQLGTIRANQPMLQNQLGQQNLNFATSGINQILGEQGSSKALKMGTPAGPRTGGLAPLLGGAAGAYFGGPGGAQAGMAGGQALTQLG